jgi:flagellar L-ring protein FlgH
MTTLLLLLALVSPADARKNKKVEQPPPIPEKPALIHTEPVEAKAMAGSLWAEVPARQLMGLDNNARQVGDLITVRITERTATSLGATTDTSKDSSNSAGISALLGIETTITNAMPNMGGEIAIGTSSKGSYKGDGSTTRGASVEAMLTCEVIEVLPTGNLRVWGWKQVRVNRETQYVVLDGIVRPRDIQMDNTVTSELLAQAKIEVTGSGVISDKQGPGIGTRLLDRLWPF